jgi:biopolymer transport protein ExbB
MFFYTLLREGGPFMPLILLTALIGYVLSAERLLAWGYWHYSDRPLFKAEDAAAFAAYLDEPGPRRRPTPLLWLLLCAKGYRDDPPEARDKAIHLDILSRLPEVDARIATIGWLGGILPMLGLLGTVSGMIVTFKDLALTTSRQVLSQGLSEALWTTEVGLLAALPLLAVHHLLTRLKTRWLNQLELNLALLFESPAATASRREKRPAGDGSGAHPGVHHET